MNEVDNPRFAIVATENGESQMDDQHWLKQTSVDEIVLNFRTLMLEDLDHARCIHPGIEEAMRDPVLHKLASAAIDDELSPEEMERGFQRVIEDSKTGDRVSAEDAQREILG